MSVQGQNAKYSSRVDVFRFASKPRRISDALRGPGDAAAYRVFELLACLHKFPIAGDVQHGPTLMAATRSSIICPRGKDPRNASTQFLALDGAGRQACVDP